MLSSVSQRHKLLRLMGAVGVLEMEARINSRKRREERHKRHLLEQLGVRKNIPGPK